jgi:hypothetical protein
MTSDQPNVITNVSAVYLHLPTELVEIDRHIHIRDERAGGKHR